MYRNLVDENMDPANYFGYAERHWGLVRGDGGAKPALATWQGAAATAWPPAPPFKERPFNATFGGVKVDEWWVQTSVMANKVISQVEARVSGGPWTDLPRQGWGGYAKSIRVLNGQTVEFRATDAEGATNLSAQYGRGGVVVQPLPPSPPPSGSLVANFNLVKLQEWWVQVGVQGDRPIAKVEARVNNGSWIDLPKQSWGEYARSIHVLWGQHIDFRATATDGTTAISGAFIRGGPTPQPEPGGLTATFSSVQVYQWWVQVDVSADKPVMKVEARVNNGAWVPLPKQNWGSYAASIQVNAGQSVDFRATATDGSSAISGKYLR